MMGTENIKSLWTFLLTPLRTNLGRCFMWRLNLVEPTSRESGLLDAAKIHDATLRSYIVWRRSQMLCAVLPLMFSILLGLYNLPTKNDVRLNTMGNLVKSLPFIGNIFILFAVIGAIGIPYPNGKFRVWSNWRVSKRIIRIGFVISFILPIIPAFIPLQYLSTTNLPQTDTEYLGLAVSNSTAAADLMFKKIYVSGLDQTPELEAIKETVRWNMFQLEMALSNFIK
jgi:hypothetical protein